MKILRNLADKEAEVQDVMTARREKAKADAKWMKQVKTNLIHPRVIFDTQSRAAFRNCKIKLAINFKFNCS